MGIGSQKPEPRKIDDPDSAMEFFIAQVIENDNILRRALGSGFHEQVRAIFEDVLRAVVRDSLNERIADIEVRQADVELSGDDTAAGGLLGMLAGLLGGPVGVLLGGTAGALMGMAVDSAEAVQEISLIEQVTTKLLAGDTAMIVLAQEANEEVFNARLSDYQTTIIRHDAAVVAAEVERVRELQAELAREAKFKMRAEKKEELKQAVAKLKAKSSEIRGKIADKIRG